MQHDSHSILFHLDLHVLLHGAFLPLDVQFHCLGFQKIARGARKQQCDLLLLNIYHPQVTLKCNMILPIILTIKTIEGGESQDKLEGKRDISL